MTRRSASTCFINALRGLAGNRLSQLGTAATNFHEKERHYPGRRPSAGEPLTQQHRQIGSHQACKLIRSPKRLVGGRIVALNPSQKLTQTRLALFGRSFHIQQPRHPIRQEVFILQARDCLARGHPTVALPVDADENVALLKVGPVKIARRVRTRAKLEHHRCQLESFDRAVYGTTLFGQLSQESN